MTGDRVFIQENILKVREKVREAALRIGRNPDDITIIAVSKTVSPERIRMAYECGIVDFGENRVQELREKTDILDLKCNWHLIGHLQTNKVKYIIGKVKLIHSLDSIGLAEEIQKRAKAAGLKVNALVQVNVAGEETKHGIKPKDAIGFVKEVAQMENIRIKGLMTIAPLVENPEEVRWVFADLRKLLIDIRKENIDNIDMDYLSMGMSNDFEVAIEEGANLVRIGTAIFGRR